MKTLGLIIASIAILVAVPLIWFECNRDSHSVKLRTLPTEQDNAIGHPAPDFMLPDLNGNRFTLSKHRGHPIILGFFCGCNRCQAAAVKIATEQRAGKLRNFVAVVSMDPAYASAWKQQTGLKGTMVVDPSDAVAAHWGSEFCPRLWCVSGSGTVRYCSQPGLSGSNLQTTVQLITEASEAN